MSQSKTSKNNRWRRGRSPLPVALAAGGLLLIIAAFFAFNKPAQNKAPVEVSGGPSLKVDQEEVNLGEVKLGQSVDVSFQLTNAGDETLRFTKAPYIEVLEGC